MGPGRSWPVSRCGGYSGGGVSLGDGNLLGLAGLLPAVGAEALTFQHGGTGMVKAMRDVHVWLALHEGPLKKKKRDSTNFVLNNKCVTSKEFMFRSEVSMIFLD